MKNWEKIKFNRRLKQIQIKRSRIFDLIREFFKKKGFLEMQTPILVKCAGQEPYLDPLTVNFKNERNKKYKGFLITSPEYSLKKSLAAGFNKVFELARVFRGNESFGGTHNIEFTMLEWYRTHSDYKEIMKDTEGLVYFLNKKINNSSYLKYQGNKIDLTPPWPKITVKQAFLKYADINLDRAKTLKSFKIQLRDIGYPSKYPSRLSASSDWNDIFYSVFLNEIEPNLPREKPVIIYDYPLPQAALSKRKSRNSFYAERFEVYAAGLELANAYSELTDAKEQLQRLKKEQILRKKMKKSFIPLDKDFISALKLGIPPSGGIALGADRLQMLLLDIKDINDLMLFPDSQLFC